MQMQEQLVTIVAATVATLLQVFLAPHIGIGYAVPNFLLVLCLTLAVMRSSSYGPILPFVTGLLYDLFSGGPVGAMAFTLTACSSATAWFHSRAGNDTLFMSLVALAVGMFVTELVYGIVVMMFGYSANFIEAIAFRTLPCYLYDLVLAVITLLVVSRFSGREEVLQPEIKRLQ